MTPTVCEQPSHLLPTHDGILKVKLIQAPALVDVLGFRHGFLNLLATENATEDDVAISRARLDNTDVGILNVISFHRGIAGCRSELERLSETRTIVSLGGVDKTDYNWTFIAEKGAILQQAKLSLSSEDEQCGQKRGTVLNVFCPENGSEAVRWAALNCHDYTDVRLLLPLLEKRIELLVIVTFNNATRLYWEYAIADVHRLFCFVVIVNFAEMGGSGVFAPFRRIGFDKNATYGAGGELFGARGPADFIARLDLDIGELRTLRREFKKSGLAALEKGSTAARGYTAVVPSEHYMKTAEHGVGAPRISEVEDIPTPWDFKKLRVAVAQLPSMNLRAYIDSKYRIRNHPACAGFQMLLEKRLIELEGRCQAAGKAASGALLDFLILPEVFAPRPFVDRYLSPMSDRLGATIVCGLDYPGDDDSDNANEVVILRPRQPPVYYRKVTRSQYDALADTQDHRMPMQRGAKLTRFVNKDGRGFGVLICYDFSHLDLIAKLNLQDRVHPLDVLIVVAHNPFGDLYRKCCIADSHRFYQYIIMCNAAEYGGSGVFAPCRTKGSRQTLLEIGKGAESITTVNLDLEDLHNARLTEDTKLHDNEFMRRPGIFQSQRV